VKRLTPSVASPRGVLRPGTPPDANTSKNAPVAPSKRRISLVELFATSRSPAPSNTMSNGNASPPVPASTNTPRKAPVAPS
jgi:hypothetical protein